MGDNALGGWYRHVTRLAAFGGRFSVSHFVEVRQPHRRVAARYAFHLRVVQRMDFIIGT